MLIPKQKLPSISFCVPLIHFLVVGKDLSGLLTVMQSAKGAQIVTQGASDYWPEPLTKGGVVATNTGARTVSNAIICMPLLLLCLRIMHKWENKSNSSSFI
jgi:hypothetical protein